MGHEALRALRRGRLLFPDDHRGGDGKFDVGHLDKELKAEGFEVSPGYGKLKDTTFRIGHMGDLTTSDIKDLLSDVMDEVLEDMK